jgi:hypothetical protein
VNLTRFPLFFPEKRPFFLENAQVFQLGQPRAVDLFFSRRIGLSPGGEPIDIVGGGRLSGKLGGYNIGLLNMQTDAAVNERLGQTVGARQQFQRAAAAARSGPIELRRDVRRPPGCWRPGAGTRLQPRVWDRSRLADVNQRSGNCVSGTDRFAADEGRVRLRRRHVVPVHQ